MIEHLKQSGAMTAVQTSCMVYDPFLYHRGAASDGPKTGGRLFIMLCASSLSAEDQKAMRSTNDIKRAWKIPPVARPTGDEEESSSEEDSDDGEEDSDNGDEGDSDDGEDAAIREQREQLEGMIDAAHAAGNHELGEALENNLAGLLKSVYGEEWRAHL